LVETLKKDTTGAIFFLLFYIELTLNSKDIFECIAKYGALRSLGEVGQAPLIVIPIT
jgi:hypothetical protein